MTKKLILRLAAAALICAAALALAACNNNAGGASSQQEAKYTWRHYNVYPENWNPHIGMGTNISQTMYNWYLSSPFVTIVVPEDKSRGDWEWKFVTATAITDITARFPDKAKWGIAPDARERFVYTVDLRRDLRWQDGTPINAHSYVNSARLLLDPGMKNRHADGLFSGTTPLVGATNFFNGEGDWESVGIYASGDYQLTWVFEIPVSMFDFRYGVSGGFLVHEGLYNAGMTTIENLMATNYHTSLETTMSFGPYKLVNAEVDKQLVLTRNENWFGYNDRAFDKFYMTTDVVIDVVTDPSAQMLLFNQGQLDRINLQPDDLQRYRFSEYLRQTETTNLFRYTFNSDLNALRTMELTAGDGFNRRVLSIRDFRRAISFAIDRVRLNQQATAGWKPAVALLVNYYYNIANDPNSKFRDTEPAMQALVDFYGFSYGPGTPYPTLRAAHDAITGYNLDFARELFQAAYEQAIRAGIYTPGQRINIQVAASAAGLTATNMRQQDVMNELLAEATVGTGFQGLVSLTYVGNYPGRFLAVSEGRIEAILTAWGGAIFNPFSVMGVYTNTINMGGVTGIHEGGGWNPSIDRLTITYDFNGSGTPQAVSRTFQEWHQSIVGSGEFAAEDKRETALFVLARLEAGVLGTYQTIPWGEQTGSELFSMKVNTATRTYNVMVDGWGPMSQVTYNYTDAEWARFVASQGGTLNYE